MPVDNDIVEVAKHELMQELNNNRYFEFEDVTFEYIPTLIKNVNYQDILHYIFNVDMHASVEVLMLPKNRNELIFKLKTSDRSFGLIKIGNILPWLKSKLGNYEIIGSYDNQSYFHNINNNYGINNLM